MLDINKIMELLPHRYPFLLVDRVIEFELGKSLTAIKNVTINEPFFPGHFPRFPVMPGVLILEALAQTCGLFAAQSMIEMDIPMGEDAMFLFAGIDGVRFKQKVVPGDQLLLRADVDKHKSGIWKFNATAKVNDKVICSGNLLAAYKEGE